MKCNCINIPSKTEQVYVAAQNQRKVNFGTPQVHCGLYHHIVKS